MSIGFGPRLAEFRLGATRITLRTLPLGGVTRVRKYRNTADGLQHLVDHGVQYVDNRGAIYAAGSFFNLVVSYVLFSVASAGQERVFALVDGFHQMHSVLIKILEVFVQLLRGSEPCSIISTFAKEQMSALPEGQMVSLLWFSAIINSPATCA